MANTQRLFVCSRSPDETLTDWQRERMAGPLLPMDAIRETRSSDWMAGGLCLGGIVAVITAWGILA